MKYRGAPNWPPTYLTQTYRQELIDEFGILRDVSLDAKVPNRCFLTVEMNGLGYVGSLQFDNFAFRTRFIAALNEHLNKPIKEIGDLEFPE
jgi:hypothetical protein